MKDNSYLPIFQGKQDVKGVSGVTKQEYHRLGEYG